MVGKFISAKWNRFGRMVGLSYELDGIEEMKIDDRLSAVLDVWKKKYFKKTPYNWRNVIQTLRLMEDHEIADQVVQQLVKESHTGNDS